MVQPLLSGTSGSLFQQLASVSAAAASANGSAFGGFERYSTADFFLNVTLATGTSPTLNVIVQTLAPDGKVGAGSGTWVDILAFNQTAISGKQWAHFIAGANSVFTPTTGTLAAGTFANVNLGGYLRIAYVIGGTNPSFSFTVSCHVFS